MWTSEVWVMPVGAPHQAQARDSFAEAGGMPVTGADPSYYRVAAAAGEDALAATLGSVAAAVADPCSVMISPPPSSLGDLNVAVDCTLITASSADADGSSWSYGATDSILRVVGAACERLRTAGGELEVVRGCGTL